MFFGMPDALRRLTWIPVTHALLGAGLAVALAPVWRQRWWDLPRRLAFTLIVAALVLQVSFLVEWNYLPPVW